jgi:Domain of unknown function (DUF4411)
MLYLFDANVLITANNTYYAIDQVPEYWEWIQYQGEIGNIKLPLEIMEEILAGQNNQKGKKNEDLLLVWIKQAAIKRALLLDEKVDADLVNAVIETGYAPDLTDTELEEIGRDPFLIACAMAGNDRCVVTTETSAPKKQRQNRKIPDVCKTFDVECHTPFKVNRDLGFKTGWKA